MPRLHLAALLAGLLAGASGAHAAGLCIVPTESGVNSAWGCGAPVDPVSNSVRGFGTTVSEACVVEECVLTEPGRAPASGVPYCWSISTSPTDPFATVGPLGDGVGTLYLWRVSNIYGELGLAEFRLEGSGGLEPLAFNPEPGYSNEGTSTDLRLAPDDCFRSDPHLVGSIVVFLPPLPVERKTWGSIKSDWR